MNDKQFFQDTFSAVRASEETVMEVLKMRRKMNKRNTGTRAFRAVLIAAVLVCLMATTAFAYAGFVVYENPEEMIEALFGENGQSHSDGTIATHPDGDLIIEPTFDRVPVDEELSAEYIEPYLAAVGSSFTSHGYTLTVESNQYDSYIGCGVLYYTIENPDGLGGYGLQSTGEIWQGDGPWSVHTDPLGSGYIDTANCTDTKLGVAVHYINLDPGKTVLTLRFNMRTEESPSETMESITIPLDDGGNTHGITLADGGIKVSATGIRITMEYFPEFAKEDGYLHSDNIKTVAIRYTDGEEYTVVGTGNIINVSDARQNKEELVYTFNRIVDIDNIAEVVLNGVSFPVE